MIRRFADLWKSPRDKEPDLFDYAIERGVLKGMPERRGRKGSRKLAVAMLVSLYPLFFAAGYFIHKETGCPGEREETGDALPSGTARRVLSEQERRFIGAYDLIVSGHEADLYIYELKNGGLGGAMRFRRWGKRELEYLRAVGVVQNRIDFIRSCRGEACARIGSPTPFHQVYTGTLSQDGERIEGTYTGGQSASGWKANRARK